MKRMLVMAGGTGGHIIPALTIADYCYAQGVKIYWLGSVGGMEQKLVPESYTMLSIKMKGLRKRGVVGKCMAPWLFLKSLCQALVMMMRVKPDLVLGMGGYVTAPGGVAAWLLRVPLVIHEQNAIAGYANRLLSRFSDQVLVAFPQAFPSSVSVKSVGNPVRTDLINLPSSVERLKFREGPLRVLILGGSRGASAINERVVACFSQWPEAQVPLIWHQTGESDFEPVSQAYEACAPTAMVDAFIDDMAMAYEWADVVIGRAGALTVSELATVGLASILIPYPYAVDDHQYHNAMALEQAGGAKVVREQACTAEGLQQQLLSWSKDRSILKAMSESCEKLASLDAATSIIATCEHVVRQRKGQKRYHAKTRGD